MKLLKTAAIFLCVTAITPIALGASIAMFYSRDGWHPLRDVPILCIFTLPFSLIANCIFGTGFLPILRSRRVDGQVFWLGGAGLIAGWLPAGVIWLNAGAPMDNGLCIVATLFGGGAGVFTAVLWGLFFAPKALFDR